MDNHFDNTPIVTIAPKKMKREELRFPEFRWVLATDWLDKIGEKSFCLYLRLFTMADRSSAERENDILPTSVTSLIKRLDMAKSTFMRLVKPLYEYGLIDYIEYKESKIAGQKPVNIIVYEYPQNEEDRMKKPLEKYRSWEERVVEQFPDTLKGGRKKNESDPVSKTKQGVEEGEVDPVSKTKHPPVSKMKHPPVSKTKHINSLNTNTNSLNPNNHSFVNKDVDKSENDVRDKEFTEQEINRLFREKVQDSAFRHYATMRTEYGMKKESFIKVVDMFVDETIRDNRHMTIQNLDAYVTGFIKNVQKHRTIREKYGVEDLYHDVPEYVEGAIAQQDESVQNTEVPSDDELQAMLTSLTS